MRVTLINTTWWQGKEYRDFNMPCTQECTIIVAYHHIMNNYNKKLVNSIQPHPLFRGSILTIAVLSNL